MPQMPSLPQRIDPSAVLAALDELVASPAFGKAERPGRFLRHLVESTLRDETDHLKESVLGVEIFGRPPNWNPRLDTIVRQEASRLRKRLARYYETDGSRATLEIRLPVGSYVPLFLTRPEVADAPTLVAEQGDTPLAPVASKAKLFPWRPIAAVVLCLSAVAAVWQYRRLVATRENARSLAVLPFANLSPGQDSQYFVDGLTDEITDLLARNKSLRVVARSSASQFKAQTGDIADVGRKLNVANILEGSVERSGDRIKIITHLERTSDGFHLWSNTYERRSADLFAVQSELAFAIAGNLKAAAGLPPAKHIPKPEANDWMMKGRYEMQLGTPQALARAATDFQTAIDVDPGYAAAYAALGVVKYNQSGARVGLRTETERRESEVYSRKALELDPDLPGPHVLLANLAMQYEWDWIGAERELRLALSSTPDASAYNGYATFLIFRGRAAAADEYLRRAQDLDPFGVGTLSNMISARYLQSRFEEQHDLARKLFSITPDMVSAQLGNAATDAAEGHPERAWPVFQKLKERAPAAAAMSEAWTRSALGEREESLRLIRPYEEKYPNAGVAVQGFALVYAHLRDEANTLMWLERSADAREWQALTIAVNPAFKSMEGSPGFRKLKKRMGLELLP
jgi:TolB-like protein/Tfp pilus assembly protein PilF